MKVEQDLFTMDKIEKDYFQEVEKFPLLTKEEEFELGKRIQMGDEEAVKKLVLHNLRLLTPIARKYEKISNRDFLDIIQDGAMGLVKAAKKFDITKNCHFSTIATPYIYHFIQRQKEKTDEVITKPVAYNSLHNKIVKETSKLTNELGRYPSIEEIANKLELPKTRIKEILEMFSSLYYLNEPVKEEGCELFEITEDKQVPSVEKTVLDKLEVEKLQEILGELTEREQYIIKQHFGMNAQKNEIPHEIIGLELNISKARVGQIERKAFGKLRNKLIKIQKCPQKKYTL